MKKRFLAFIIAIISIFPCLSGCFNTSDNPWGEDTDYVEIINDVALYAMKFNVSVELSYRESFISPENVFMGSGVIIKEINNSASTSYFIVTNNHVVDTPSNVYSYSYTVYDCSNDGLKATLLRADSTRDLALLKVEDSSGVWADTKVATISTKNVTIGEEVISLGQPESQKNTFTIGKFLGIVSAPEMETETPLIEVIKHNAYINHGSSGGALLNLNLELIGINYAGGINKDNNEFINGYSVPSSELIEFLSEAGVSF